jgi:6-phosphofructokinase 2
MNPSLDISMRVESLVPNRKLRAKRQRREPGGGGINVARALHRCGGEVRAVFPAGGAAAERLCRLLDDEGVVHDMVPVEPDLRENFSVHVDEPGELYHFVTPGPELTVTEVEDCLQALKSIKPAPAYLVASGSLPGGVSNDFYSTVAGFARDNGVRLILDTSGPGLAAAIRAPVYLIKPNRHEFAHLLGEPVADDDAVRCDQARRLLAAHDLEVLIVTLGRQGALLTTPGQQLMVRPPHVEPVSPVGAGDSFLAVLVLKLAQDETLRNAICFAVAGAAAAVKTPGTELFDPSEVDALYDQLCSTPDAVRTVGRRPQT